MLPMIERSETNRISTVLICLLEIHQLPQNNCKIKSSSISCHLRFVSIRLLSRRTRIESLITSEPFKLVWSSSFVCLLRLRPPLACCWSPLLLSRSRRRMPLPPARASSSPSFGFIAGFPDRLQAASQEEQQHQSRQPLTAISSPTAATTTAASSSLAAPSVPPPSSATSALTAAAAARKNSAGDLAAGATDPANASPGYATVSEARLLYRNWRTGSHVGADLHHLHDPDFDHTQVRK